MAALSTKQSVKILHCDCDTGNGAKFQDIRYGKGKRVHNPNKNGYKCTVCGKNKANKTE